MIYISKNKVFRGSGFNLLILTFVNITTLFVAQKSLLANELLLNMADQKKKKSLLLLMISIKLLIHKNLISLNMKNYS